jgi:hypothetical protein
MKHLLFITLPGLVLMINLNMNTAQAAGATVASYQPPVALTTLSPPGKDVMPIAQLVVPPLIAHRKRRYWSASNITTPNVSSKALSIAPSSVASLWVTSHAKRPSLFMAIM